MFRIGAVEGDAAFAASLVASHMAEALQGFVAPAVAGNQPSATAVVLETWGAHSHRSGPHRLPHGMRAASSHGLSQLALLRVASVEYPGVKWSSLDRSLLNAPSASKTETVFGDVYGRTAEVWAHGTRLFAHLIARGVWVYKQAEVGQGNGLLGHPWMFCSDT